MDEEIWKFLPVDLSHKICNMLTRVRRIPEQLKREIVRNKRLYGKIEDTIIEKACLTGILYNVKMMNEDRWEQLSVEQKESLYETIKML